MKKIMPLLLALLCLLMTALPAAAEESPKVIRISGESELPADWADKDTLRVSFLDMQRSDAILLQCGGESMLVDGGYGSYYKRLFRVLDDSGITQLKYLWSTHCDGDHSQGLKCVMNSDLYGTGVLLCPNPKTYDDPDDDHEKMVYAADKHGWTYQQIANGDVFTLGTATITTLHCDENWGQNSRSAACFVDFGERSMLLTGDIGSNTQEYFLEHVAPERLDCDILKAPHHGINRTVDSFINAVSPEAIVIPNRSNNGSHATWNAYKPLYAGDGIVVFETDGNVWYYWQLPNWLDKEMGT